MRNPLGKRYGKELLKDIGKYLVIFIFMAATIGFVSGFLVADGSMIEAYEESFGKYNVEDGRFELAQKAGEELLQELEQEGVTIYENFYVEEEADHNADGVMDSTIRVFPEREQVDLVCLMEGELPEEADGIAIDRMFADNNGLKPGDSIEVGGLTLTVTGLVALSDYSALFQNNGDMMFDSIKFGVAVMTKEGFEDLGEMHLHYSYAWIYDQSPVDDVEEKEMSEDFLKVLGARAYVTGFVPRYANQAIQFTGEDMGSDESMMIVLLYILIVILAFVFGVTTSNTIAKEASVIGTLRASGYTRGELLRHYLFLPAMSTLFAAIVGNVLGYTVFKDLCAAMYYGSYSLPTYETRWNADAFLMTTVIPMVLMLLINVFLLSRKLTFSPLQFLRRDLNRTKRKKAVKLPHFTFFSRFRIRIILQNAPNYVTLFLGILFANVLLLFGMMMSPLLSHFQEETVSHMLADYQYVLKAPVETDTQGAEKMCVKGLKTIPGRYESEEIMAYGIWPDSQYFQEELPEQGVYISDGYADKYNLKAGDTITLKEAYGEEEYSFEIRGVYEYPAALAVFMDIREYREIFDTEEDYFNGYFSDREAEDIDEMFISTRITQEDLTKLSRQLDVSMGEMFQMVNVFAVVLFALLIYLLTRLIIEKNTTSISMVKILGYENREISSLYLMATTWVVIVSTGLSLLLSTWVIRWIYGVILMSMHGWLTFYIEPSIYPRMFLMGLVAYVIVALFQFSRIKKIPMDEALKNVE